MAFSGPEYGLFRLSPENEIRIDYADKSRLECVTF